MESWYKQKKIEFEVVDNFSKTNIQESLLYIWSKWKATTYCSLLGIRSARLNRKQKILKLKLRSLAKATFQITKDSL